MITIDYFNVSDNNYYRMLSYPLKRQRLRVEFLDHFENTLYRVEQDIDASSAGRIINNNSQGTRRSFSFDLVNANNFYNLLDEDTFWFNRKFRVWLGMTNGKDTYWFSKGVYITQNAHLDSVTQTVEIDGVDKYAQLDGTLNVLQADEVDTVFEVGSKIDTVIRDILTMNLGNDLVLDPIEPIIDPVIGEQRIYKEFTMSAGSYYGDFLTEVMTSFGCDIFYDTLGRLTVRRIFNDDRPYWYAFKSPAYHFNDEIWGYQSPNISIDMKGVNKIIVATENIGGENVSETALNNNPRSPLCYQKIGRRTLTENGGIIRISLGDKDVDTPETKCREYAEYRLMQETCVALEASFQCPPIYHLCEGDVITITDKALGFDQESFIINSIEQSTSTDEMSVNATNLKYLPTDIYNDAIYTLMIRQPGVYYTITYVLGDAQGTTPTPIRGRLDTDFVAAMGYSNHQDTFKFPRTGSEIGWDQDTDNEFVGWTGSDGNDYVPGETYQINNNTSLYANSVNVVNNTLFIRAFKSGSDAVTYSFPTLLNQSADVESYYLSTFNNYSAVDSNKYYITGRGQENVRVQITIPTTADSAEITYHATSSDFDSQAIASMIAQLSALKLSHVYFPESLEVLDFSETPFSVTPYTSDYCYIKLPNNLKSVDYVGGFLTIGRLFSIALSYNYPVNYTSKDGSPMLCNSALLRNVTASELVTIKSEGSSAMVLSNCPNLYSVQFSKGLALYNVVAFMNYPSSDPVFASLDFNDLSLYDSNFLSGQNTRFAVTINNFIAHVVSSSSVSAFAGGAMRNLSFTGNVDIEGNNSVISGISFTSSTVLNIGGNVTSVGTNSFVTGTNVSSIDISGDLTLSTGKDGHSTSSSSTYFVMGNSSLQTIKIHGDVLIDATYGTSRLTAISGNSNLTDLYLYSSNFSVIAPTGSSVSLFGGNNSDFKIHGIAGSAVETYCNTNSIPFVALTAEELSEV